MVSQPPMAGFSPIIVEGLLEILLRRFEGESRCLGMQSHDPAAAINQDKKIAGRNLRNILGSILNGYGIGTRHDGARDRQICQQGHVASQHRFAFMTEILECGN